MPVQFVERGTSCGSRKSPPKAQPLRRRLPICSTSTLPPRINWTPCLGSVPPIPRRSSTAAPTRLRRIWYARKSFPRPPTTRSKTRSSPNKSSVPGLEHPVKGTPALFPLIFHLVPKGGPMGLLGQSRRYGGLLRSQVPILRLRGFLQMIQNHPGGLNGLVQAFHQNGLGGLVNSWIGTGQNQPATSEQIQQVLGSGQVQALAPEVGRSAGSRRFNVGTAAANRGRQTHAEWLRPGAFERTPDGRKLPGVVGEDGQLRRPYV